jgi:hypothetical protein
MEVQPVLTGQRAKVDIYGSPESVPTGKSPLLLALDIPERIADVLKIEFHSTLQKARPLAAPAPKEVTVWALTGLVTVRTA